MPERHEHHLHHSHQGALRLWHVALDYRYVILATLSLFVIGAAVAGYVLTPIYRAEALVVVEDELPQIVGVQGVMPSEALQDRHYKTQVTLITSRTVLRTAAKTLDIKPTKGAGPGDPFDAIGVDIFASPVTNTKLIRVAAEGPDKLLVDDIANAVVNAFREESIRRRRSSSEFASSWIGEQLPRLRGEVQAAEERLYKYQEEKKVLSLDRTADIVSQRLAQLNQDLTSAEKARRELEAELMQIENTGGEDAALDFLPVVSENRTVRELDLQILSLQNERTDLLRTMKSDHRDIVGLEAKIADLEDKRHVAVSGIHSALKRRLAAARINESMVREALAEQQKKTLEVNEKRIKLAALHRDVERAKQLYEPMLERFGELDLASGLNAVPVQVIEYAEEPVDPVKPRKQLIMFGAALLGLLAGFQLALLLDRSYSKVRSPEELERTVGLVSIGGVPHMDAKDDKTRALVCYYDKKSVAAEAYRSIRTRLLSAAPDDGALAFLVTGALNDEGKTTTALNMAAAFAQTKKRVLLVDADMRRSSVHKALDVSRERGLSTCLGGAASPEEAVQESSVPSLDVITAGEAPENPAELLHANEMREFLRWARSTYDFIVIDSPPVAVVTDASILASLVDGVLIVVRANRTPRNAVAHGRELLGNVKDGLVVAVLNDIPRSAGRYYGYGGYYYGHYGHYRGGYYAEGERA